MAIGNGVFLGGFARGQESARTLGIEESRLALADRQLQAEEATAMRQSAQAAFDQTMGVVESIFTNSTLSREETWAKHRGTLEGLIAEAASIGETALGIPAQATLAQVGALQTARDLAMAEAGIGQEIAATAAVADAQNSVMAASAEEQALIANGFDPEVARQMAFDIPEAPVSYSIVPGETLGLPAGSLVQQGSNGQTTVLYDGGAEGGMSDADRLKIEQDLRRDFDKASQEFDLAQTQMISMERLAQDATGASDIALVFSLFKVLDPNSTVREGEFATAASAAGLSQQIIQGFQRLDDGQILPETLRSQLVDTARTIFGLRLQQQGNREAFYTDLASKAGVDPTSVVSGRVVGGDTGRFATMSLADIAAIDTATLTDAERKQLEAELDKRGL